MLPSQLRRLAIAVEEHVRICSSMEVRLVTCVQSCVMALNWSSKEEEDACEAQEAGLAHEDGHGGGELERWHVWEAGLAPARAVFLPLHLAPSIPLALKL